uniref:Retrotransposon protein, putative, unclassified n=1 Tax=Oryza sativa subsp. japonica TaxID=39947 RepID=Q2QTV3_ORYSJ|nr:retrotransposon protein, putative, unclassified [Oryza sativa Japonica Group]
MMVPKNPVFGVWKENRSEVSTSKAPKKTKVTFDMLLEKYEKQGGERARNKGKRPRLPPRERFGHSSRRSQSPPYHHSLDMSWGPYPMPPPGYPYPYYMPWGTTPPMFNHMPPMQFNQGWGGPRRPIHERLSSPNNGRFYGKNRVKEEKREGKRVKAGLTADLISVGPAHLAGLTGAFGRSDRWSKSSLTGIQRRFDRRFASSSVRASSSSNRLNRGHYLPPRTEPKPRWMPKDLMATQRRRLQRLRAQEIREKKAEEQRDRSPKDAVFEKPDKSNRHMKPLYLKGHVDGKQVSRMLVDGGAAVNLMPYSLFKKLGREDDELKKTNMILNGFNGEPTEAKGIFSAEFTVGNKTLPTAFFIVDVKEANLELLQKRVQEYRSTKNDIGETIEDFDEVEKLGKGFTSANPLEEVDIGDGIKPRPTFINKNLRADYKVKIIELLKEYVDCFAWEYHEIPGLSRELVEHRLPIKPGFRPYKQPPRRFNPLLYDRVKEEIDRLLKDGFIRPRCYAEWVSSIVPVEKKGSCKIRVCKDFRDLNKATPKDEYPMPIADMMINGVSGHKVISFLDGNAGYNQIFMAEEDMYKTAFRCPGFVGLLEWVVMTFGSKNVGATYQRAMNLIFHDLLGIILEIYIDDIVVKSNGMEGHIADLRLAFERMRRSGLKMNPLKCAFDKVIGAVLTQEEDGKEYIITYLSRRLLDAETRYIARHDNSRANDLSQQASCYNVKKGLFLVLEESVLDFKPVTTGNNPTGVPDVRALILVPGGKNLGGGGTEPQERGGAPGGGDGGGRARRTRGCPTMRPASSSPPTRAPSPAPKTTTTRITCSLMNLVVFLSDGICWDCFEFVDDAVDLDEAAAGDLVDLVPPHLPPHLHRLAVPAIRRVSVRHQHVVAGVRIGVGGAPPHHPLGALNFAMRAACGEQRAPDERVRVYWHCRDELLCLV